MSENKVPKEGEFQGGKLWFTRRGSVLTIGLTSRAIEKMGDLESIELPEEGDNVDEGDTLVVIEGNVDTIEISAMSAGTVLEVNPVAENLELLAEDPTEEGWLIKFQLEDLEELADLE